MATIRVKRSTLSAAPTGLTFGEPAFVDGINSFYITKNNGTSLRVGAEVDSSTSLGTSHNKIPTQGAVKSYVDGIVTGGDGLVNSLNGLTGALTLAAGAGIAIDASVKAFAISNTGVTGIFGTSNQITASASTGRVTLSLPSALTVPGSLSVTTDLTVTGNLTVNGTTTTVNSDTITVDDPLMVLGTSGGVALSVSDGGKDRGIAFSYYSGVAGNTGFFGYDASLGKFIFSNSASVSNDVVTVTSYTPVLTNELHTINSGFLGQLIPTTLSADRTYTLPNHSGTVVAPTNLGTSDYILKANGTTSQPTWVAQSSLAVGSASTLTTARTIGITGDINGTATSFDGSANINISAVIAPNSVELGTDTTGNYVATLSTSSTGLSVANSGSESAAVTVNFSTITSGLNMGTFSFATGEFTNSSGTVSIGTVDGGTFT